MAKKKSKAAFCIDSSYGWTEFNVSSWITKMKRVSVKLELLQEEHDLDAIACAGSSGMMAASVLGTALKLPVVYVRKSGEKSHGNSIESNTRKPIKKYIIVDDLVCSGSTINSIITKIEGYAKDHNYETPQCIGAFLYNDESTKGIINACGRKVKIFK